MELEVRGIEKLSKALKKRADLSDVKKVVQMNGAEMQRGAQRRAPVDTGFLKRSIELSIEDGGFTAKVAATAHYAPYLEWGTRFMTAQPFVRPSFFTQRKQFIKDMQRIMK